MIILEFLNPEEISTGFKYDELVVHFKEIRDYFISKEHLVDLSEDSRTVKGKVPKLLSQSALSNSLKGVSDSLDSGMKATMGFTVLLNLIFSGILAKFIQLIRTLQLVTHLLMFKIVAPANVMIFIEAILPVTQYDYLEPYWTDLIIKVFRIDVDG